MPYVICDGCRLTTYSAALWSSTDACPHCGDRLPVSRRATVIALARDAGLLDPGLTSRVRDELERGQRDHG